MDLLSVVLRELGHQIGLVDRRIETEFLLLTQDG